jgi:hypothetical protein
MNRDCLLATNVALLRDESEVTESNVEYNEKHGIITDIRSYTSTVLAERLGDNRTRGVTSSRVSSDCVSTAGAVTMTGFDQLSSRYSDNKHYSILGAEQPFAITADTTLTAVKKKNGEFVIRVDRLFGHEHNEYTILPVVNEFPG